MSQQKTRVSRRKFLGYMALTLGASVSATSAFFKVRNEAHNPIINRVTLPVSNLHAALDGFTIAAMGDFHLYPFTQLELINKAVSMTNDLKPDAVVLLGDYVWHDVDAIFDLAPALAKLNPRHGIFPVLGNHDLWTDVRVVSQGLREAGIPPVVNQRIPITVGGGTLHLAGLDDGWEGQADLPGTLDGLDDSETVVLLVHEPDLADDYAQDSRVNIQFSGHSHGGQVRLPITGPPILPYLGRKYDLGLYQVQNLWLYTNGGIGVTNEPIRYNCPPEITFATLTQA